jgi:4-hydroxythreonine-4-phosphate dehydrogenase
MMKNMKSRSCPFRLAVPMGDPAGIGPEVVLKSLSSDSLEADVCIVFIADARLLVHTSVDCGVPLRFDRTARSEEELKDALRDGAKRINFDLPCVDLDRFSYGKIDAMCGLAAYRCVEKATELAMSGICDAIVTPPLHKEALKAAGIAHVGYTEILGTLSGSENPVTMFDTLGMKIFFHTRHLSLRQACDAVTKESLLDSIIVCDAISSNPPGFNVGLPLAVAGLNPHCGEHGLFGDEELTAVEPAVGMARKLGIDVVGPIGADSVFHQAKTGRFRAVLSLYHDQGHIAAKTLDFERTVSVTWKLPFLRTSVDHGTAFDIAGKGVASPISMIEAMNVAKRYLSAGVRL